MRLSKNNQFTKLHIYAYISTEIYYECCNWKELWAEGYVIGNVLSFTNND